VSNTRLITVAVSETMRDFISVMIITMITKLVMDPRRIINSMKIAPSSSFSERRAIFSLVEKYIIRKVDKTYKPLAMIQDMARRTIIDGVDESIKKEATPIRAISKRRLLALM
jgi:hypothetical protein